MLRLPLVFRLVALAAVVAMSPLPAAAGPAENATLAKYAGEWRGIGKVTGPNPGTVVCRITFKAANSGRLSYTGRCSFSGSGAASFRGTMLYNDAARRYEAASNAQGISSQTVGKKQGGSIVFSTGAISTRYGTISSTLTLAGSAIRLAFRLVDRKGATNDSNIAFRRG